MSDDIVLHTTIEDRKVAVHLSIRAMKELEKRERPLHVTMEMYFSCLIKKILKFNDRSSRPDEVRISDKLFASFRPVQSLSCSINELDENSKPNLIDLPVVRKKAIVPRHLIIDFNKGKWTGDFSSLINYK